MGEKVTSAAVINDVDNRYDRAMRPKSLKDFTGQEKLKAILEIAITAANKRGEVMDHTLFSGPPGLGKTTLAQLIAHELKVRIRVIAAPMVSSPGELVNVITNMGHRDILFLDEIHRLNKQVEETMYSVMEDFRIGISTKDGDHIDHEVPPFTLIGATTRSGLLSSPLRDRFGQQYHLDYYTPLELTKIILRSAKILKVKIRQDAAMEIVLRSRRTPRIANRLLRSVRDFALVKGTGEITKPIAVRALDLLQIDSNGLDPMDRNILSVIIDKFDGGPVGLESIALAVGEEPDTLVEVYEPYLLQKGYLDRTRRGRMATTSAYSALNRRKRHKMRA